MHKGSSATLPTVSRRWVSSMSARSDGIAPIVIRKKKNIIAAGHHGGAWKVAYADFATAMMAFFLLMWLLNATTESQRKGLADYFNPSIPMSRVSGGGAGALNGSSLMSEDTLANDGAGQSRRLPTSGPNTDKGHGDKDGETGGESERTQLLTEDLRNIEDEINAQKTGALSPDLAKHIYTRMTPDGLMIELVDADGQPLFKAGSPAPSALMLDLLRVIGPVLGTVSNDMAITGHTDAHAFTTPNGYTNWELSSERALAARRLLINSGIIAEQIVEVAGKADTDPFSDNAFAAENRRIAITLLTADG